MIDMPRSTRPIAIGKVRQVDGDQWQASCKCRWNGRRRADRTWADIEAAKHVASCGLCVLLGREYMDVCTCANCEHRRIMQEHAQRTERTRAEA